MTKNISKRSTWKKRMDERRGTKRGEQIQLRMVVCFSNHGPASNGPRNAELMVSLKGGGGGGVRGGTIRVKHCQWKWLEGESGKLKDSYREEQVKLKLEEMNLFAERSKSVKRNMYRKVRLEKWIFPLASISFGCWNICNIKLFFFFF